jgi:hypothetical protein
MALVFLPAPNLAALHMLKMGRYEELLRHTFGLPAQVNLHARLCNPQTALKYTDYYSLSLTLPHVTHMTNMHYITVSQLNAMPTSPKRSCKWSWLGSQ